MKMANSAFRRLVKQCIAEVILEPTQDSEKFPHEKWTDTFGKKIEGAYLEEEDGPPDPIDDPEPGPDPHEYEVSAETPEGIDRQIQSLHKIIDILNQRVGRGSPEQNKEIEKTIHRIGQVIDDGWKKWQALEDSSGLVKEAEQKVDRVSPGERNKIGAAFKELGLDGNGRFEKVEAGLAAVSKALSSLGLQLDMVSKDMIMGDKGNRNFIYRRVNAPGQDVFTEQPEIKNSRIAFTWEALDRPSYQYPNASHVFEILAYAS